VTKIHVVNGFMSDANPYFNHNPFAKYLLIGCVPRYASYHHTNPLEHIFLLFIMHKAINGSKFQTAFNEDIVSSIHFFADGFKSITPSLYLSIFEIFPSWLYGVFLYEHYLHRTMFVVRFCNPIKKFFQNKSTIIDWFFFIICLFFGNIVFIYSSRFKLIKKCKFFFLYWYRFYKLF